MQIAFVTSKCLPFDAYTLRERPLGGTETAVIKLSEELARLKHRVTVFTSLNAPRSGLVEYRKMDDILRHRGYDLLISVRDWTPLVILEGDFARCKALWLLDAYDQLPTFGIGDKRVYERFDLLLVGSTWHAETLCQAAGFPRDRIAVFSAGVDTLNFLGTERRNLKRLIYSSTPFRGLKLLPQIFSKISSKIPDAELHIFSGFDVYRGLNDKQLEEENRKYASLFNELRSLRGVFLHGNILQHLLAREFMMSGILAYPSIFPETLCITALEAQAGGAVPLVSSCGSLKEIVGDAGIVIEGDPLSEKFQNEYVEKACTLMEDESLWQRYSTIGKERVKALYSYEISAQSLINFIKLHLILLLVSVLGCFKDKREPFTYSTCGKLTYPKRSDNHRDTAFKMSLKYFQRMATRNLAFIGLTEDLHRKYTLWGNSRKLCEYLATNYINEVNEVLITGYFESTLHGSKSASSRFKYPVYRLPPERVGEGKPPTFTRNEIDFGKALSERGLEILYVDDLVDLTFMHIQGSGRVLLEEGGEVRLRYAGKNGHGYRSIGKRVVELNLAPLKELSMERIKDELRKHPHLVEDILSYDPSYVFFREGEGEPIGSLNVPVTPLFSVALDQQNYQRGAPYLLIVNGKEFNVVLNQDSGGAIKGKGRVDRFLGYGKEASALASGMKDKGLLVGLYKRT